MIAYGGLAGGFANQLSLVVHVNNSLSGCIAVVLGVTIHDSESWPVLAFQALSW